MHDFKTNLKLAVIIANWNGKAWIERCLGSVLAAVRRCGEPVEVVVYDDASEDKSPEIVEKQFPGVRLIRGEKNIGYGAAVNTAMQAIAADWVFLFNNDLALQADFCERLLDTLKEYLFDNDREKESDKEDREKELFAIGAMTRDWKTRAANHGGQNAAWRDGMLAQAPFESDAAAPSDFFQAGACLIDRRKFLELGGFCPLFHPGYWEDYDIAWQAKGRGWSVLYEPRAVAWHLGKGSMRRKLGTHGVTLALRRNHLLFNWINVREGGRICEHLFSLPKLVASDDAAPGEASWGRALWEALGLLPAALMERNRRMEHLPSTPSRKVSPTG